MISRLVLDFVEIDGSQGEGGGQILRTSVSLSCILGVPIRITGIRSNRKNPGLRPQHLEAVRSAAGISNSTLRHAEIGSSVIELEPGAPQESVSKRIDVGTAGSVTLIAQTLVPIGIFRRMNLDLEIVGGTDVPASPTIDYLRKLVVPIYRMIGGDVQIDLVRRGYYPKGGGIIRVRVRRARADPKPFEPSTVGEKGNVAVVSASSCLLPSNITQREVDSASETLRQGGIVPSIEQIDSSGESSSPGTTILVYRRNESEFVGASSLGEIGKRAEVVGSEAAGGFLREVVARPNLDSHLSDMVVTLACCVQGTTAFTTTKLTPHLETNLHVASRLTGVEYAVTKLGGNDLFKVVLKGRRPELTSPLKPA